MKRVMILGLMLLCGLPLGARVVGVVIRFRGSVFIRKSGRSGLRRVYSRQPVRGSSRLILRRGGSVAVLLFSGKVLSLKQPGNYRVSAKNMLVSYNDVLRHQRRISRSGISAAVGATRGRKMSARRSPSPAPSLIRILHPAGVLADASIRLKVAKRAVDIAIKGVRILYDGNVVYRGSYKAFSRGLRIRELRPGGSYLCQVRYAWKGRKYRVHSAFRLLNRKQRSGLKNQLTAIATGKLSKAVRCYLQSVVYARYGMDGPAKKWLRKAAALDSRFRGL